jgi:outer membrane biosynthesis protein TonB
MSTGLLLAVACGGSGSGGDPKTPTGDNAAAASSSGGAAADPGAPADDPSGGGTGAGPTTTTTNLPESGELQGAKLGSSTRKEVETKGESGPKAPPGGSANEPGRSVKDIQTIIASRRDDARACYDKGLEGHPGIEGDLTIKWKITPEGNVTDAEVDSTKSQILEPTVGQCIIDIIKKIKFAPSPKGFESRANYPFNFHPRQGGAKK